MKKKILTMALLVGLLLPTGVGAKYIRPNNFLDKSGSERIAEIKKFQANSNLVVTGGLNKDTENMLYNPKMLVEDEILKSPTKGDWIVVNKTKKILTYYRNNKPMYKFPVTLGTSQTPTPSAKGKIATKWVNPAWGGMSGKYEPKKADDPLNPLGERWMGLSLPGYSGYGIHGNIKPHQIGGYYSNGCIRMFNYDIETFIFPIAKKGMPVWIGTDEELQNWGVYQKAYEKKEVEPKVEKVKTEKIEKPEEYKVEELLVF